MSVGGMVSRMTLSLFVFPEWLLTIKSSHFFICLSYIALAVWELTRQTKVASNLQRSDCPCPLSAGIKGVIYLGQEFHPVVFWRQLILAPGCHLSHIFLTSSSVKSYGLLAVSHGGNYLKETSKYCSWELLPTFGLQLHDIYS